MEAKQQKHSKKAKKHSKTKNNIGLSKLIIKPKFETLSEKVSIFNMMSK